MIEYLDKISYNLLTESHIFSVIGQNADIRVRGCADMQICRYADMRICGYADVWMRGYADMRIYGCADLPPGGYVDFTAEKIRNKEVDLWKTIHCWK